MGYESILFTSPSSLSLQILKGKIPDVRVMLTSDVDKNGIIDITENIYILQYILKTENN